ncbi:MAG: adenylate/guanylate cyclase domain-containing protein [Spirochaetes bacterium]|nr:MAG: adenylate/guanylate cyclase domain-containing protein [Spirochaetota bacterium]
MPWGRWMEIPGMERDLHFEILKSERLRMAVLLAIFTILTAGNVLFSLLPAVIYNPFHALFGAKFPFTAFMLFGCFAIAYEAALLALVHLAIRKRVYPPEGTRYGNAFGETSFVTAILAITAYSLGPEIALNSPAVLTYYFFIVLSTLRLRFSLSFFTGAVAASEYLGLSAWYFSASFSAPAEFFSSIFPCIGRSAVLLASGAVAGFVADQIMRRLARSQRLAAERTRILSLFGQHVSPAVAEKLLSQKTSFTGEERFITIMFFDIRGFTRFSENRSPGEVIEYLNAIFTHLIARVNEHNGIINKFLGDGFMAVFGAPVSNGMDVQNAVGAACAIARTVDELNARGEIPATRIGIGLHAGRAVTGNVGSEERKEYTIIGDAVNLASRVEQLNKKHRSTVLVTEAVYSIVREQYDFRPLPAVRVKGRRKPVKIYRLI